MLTNEDSNLFICQPTLYTSVTFIFLKSHKKDKSTNNECSLLASEICLDFELHCFICFYTCFFMPHHTLSVKSGLKE